MATFLYVLSIFYSSKHTNKQLFTIILGIIAPFYEYNLLTVNYSSQYKVLRTCKKMLFMKKSSFLVNIFCSCVAFKKIYICNLIFYYRTIHKLYLKNNRMYRTHFSLLTFFPLVIWMHNNMQSTF